MDMMDMVKKIDMVKSLKFGHFCSRLLTILILFHEICIMFKVRKRRAPTALTLDCNVCSAPAPDHLHFGGHCCYSCRAFFRRTIERMRKIDVVCKAGDNECLITQTSKSCSACRFEKCLRVGMKRELLQVISW